MKKFFPSTSDQQFHNIIGIVLISIQRHPAVSAVDRATAAVLATCPVLASTLESWGRDWALRPFSPAHKFPLSTRTSAFRASKTFPYPCRICAQT